MGTALMPPEDIQSMADENGHEVTHLDGYSIVHTPDGPVPVAHAARGPGPIPPAVIGVPPALARPYTPDAASQAHIDADFAEMEQQLAATRRTGRTPHAERRRELDYNEARAPRVGPHGELPPETQRLLARQTAETTRESELSALRGSGALARAQDQRARVEEGRMPTAAQEEYDPEDPVSIPSGVPSSWLAQSSMTDGLRDARRSALAADEAMATPQRTPVTSASLPEQVGEPGYSPAPQGPTLEGGYLGGPAPTAQPSAPSGLPPRSMRRAGGGVPTGGSQNAPLGAPLPRSASDGLISSLARDPRDGGSFDAPGRAYLVESQRAGLAQRAAQTQAAIEARAEQQRQGLEQDRQQATAHATRAYQNAIDRVASARISPDRWYRDQGAGGVVGATIAVALGALGQAFTGSSTNSALDQINQAIDRDIDAQRSEIESGRAAADMQGNMIGIMGQEFTDRAAAQDAARAAMLQQAALQVQQHQAELQDQEARNNADAMRAELERAAQERQQAAIDRELQRRLTAAQVARTEAQAAHEARIAMGGTARPHAVTPTQMDAYRQIVHNSPNIDPARAAELAGLPPGFVPEGATDPTTASQVQALAGELSHLEGLIPTEGDIPGHGPLDSLAPNAVTSDQGNAIRRSARQVVELLGRMHSGGAISDDEYDRFSAIVGAGATQTDADLRGGIETIRREIGSRLGGRASGSAAPDRDLADLGGEARWVE